MLKKYVLLELWLSILIILFNSSINLTKTTNTAEQDKLHNEVDIIYIYRFNTELPLDRNMDSKFNIENEEYNNNSFVPEQRPIPYIGNELEYKFL